MAYDALYAVADYLDTYGLATAAVATTAYSVANQPKTPTFPGVPHAAKIDQSQQQAVDEQRRKQAIAGGIGSTIDTGPGGTNPAQPPPIAGATKTLLGT